MNRLGWVLVLLCGALALAVYQGRASHRHAPAAASGEASSVEATTASDPRPANAAPGERRHSNDGGSPLTEPGTTAGIEGILAGSKTTPHVEDAAQKARNAMRSMRQAEDRERAALGGGGQATGSAQSSRRGDDP